MPFTQKELAGRIRKLKQRLEQAGIGLAVLNQNSDVYYYTGSVQPLYLLIPASGEPVMLARKSITRIRDEAPEITLEVFHGGKDLTEIISRHGFGDAERVGYTLDTTAYATVARLHKLFGGVEMVDISWDIRMLRAVKSEAEIAIQVRAGEIMARVPDIVKACFKPGMTEIELSAAIENYFRLHGHGAFMRIRRECIEMAGFGVCSSGTNSLAGTKFDGICAGTGASSGSPYGAGSEPVERGVPVILDYAFNLEGYIIDQTRMFSWGEPSHEVMRAYDAMVRIEDIIVAMLKPGAVWEDVYNEAAALADDAGYIKEFMGLGTEKVKFVGHGVGLELDEPPYLAPQMKDRLAAGMVIAIEPKVALPEIGVVGIEDTVVIRESGVEWLTTCSRDFQVLDR